MPKLDSRSLLLLTQGNIYNRLRFLNKYLMFLEELNELFQENWSKISDCRVSSFLKTVLGCWASRHGVNKILVDSKESFQLFELGTNLFVGRIAKKV